MPNIYNLYKEIMNIDIGTIIIFSYFYKLSFRCRKSCNVKEEFFYIQRTGESLIETEGNMIKMTRNINNNEVLNNNSSNNTNINNNKIKEEIDEEGFTIVKNKKKK